MEIKETKQEINTTAKKPNQQNKEKIVSTFTPQMRINIMIQVQILI